MKTEMDAHLKNQVYALVPSKSDRKLIKCKWVYALKVNPDGSLKFKARLVAKGFSQIEGIDYTETFAPVAKFTTIRLLATAAINGYHIDNWDVPTAFLNATLEEDIYMEQPKGFETSGPSGEKLALKLNKSLYGLKQANRNWYKLVDTKLKEVGFKQSKTDPAFTFTKMIITSWPLDFGWMTS
jgi:hypothetical protein